MNCMLRKRLRSRFREFMAVNFVDKGIKLV